MKCLHCGINYDDGDDKCPICGTTKGTGHRATVPRYTSSSHTMHDEDACTHRTFTRETRPETPTPQSYTRAAKKRGNKTGLFVIAFVVLMQVIPALISWLETASPMQNWGVFESIPAPAPEAPMPDYESWLVEVAAVDLFGAQSRGDTADGAFTLDCSADGRYSVTRTGADWEYTEQGVSFCSYNDPETDDIFYGQDYPAERYEGYLVALYADETTIEGPAPDELAEPPLESERWLVAYVERESGVLTLYDWDGTSEDLLGGETLEMNRVQNG